MNKSWTSHQKALNKSSKSLEQVMNMKWNNTWTSKKNEQFMKELWTSYEKAISYEQVIFFTRPEQVRQKQWTSWERVRNKSGSSWDCLIMSLPWPSHMQFMNMLCASHEQVMNKSQKKSWKIHEQAMHKLNTRATSCRNRRSNEPIFLRCM